MLYHITKYSILETTLGVDFWGTLVIMIACIPSAIEVKDKL